MVSQQLPSNKFQQQSSSITEDLAVVEGGEFESITTCNSDLNSQQIDLNHLSKLIKSLSKRMDDLENLVNNIDYDLDGLEQYSRRNCLLLHGCKDSELSIKQLYRF